MPWTTTEEALDDHRQGRMIILCDDAERENEGDIMYGCRPHYASGDYLHGSPWMWLDVSGHAA